MFSKLEVGTGPLTSASAGVSTSWITPESDSWSTSDAAGFIREAEIDLSATEYCQKIPAAMANKTPTKASREMLSESKYVFRRIVSNLS